MLCENQMIRHFRWCILHKCLCIFITETFKIRFKADFLCFQLWRLCSCTLYNKSFSSLCNVGHSKWGHSVCHCTLKSSKLGLKLSATIHVCWAICCLLWQLWCCIVVYLKTVYIFWRYNGRYILSSTSVLSYFRAYLVTIFGLPSAGSGDPECRHP